MPFLVKEDFETHLYSEVTDAITRGDDTKVDKALSSAIGEAKSYLSRFDLLKVFGDADTEPEVDEDKLEVLKDFVKDIASWKLAKLCNANINLELAKTNYDAAVAWLKQIQKGGADPEGWPYKVDDPATTGNENNTVQWSSNRKRTQHF
jgi:phage gp36-like protein